MAIVQKTIEALFDAVSGEVEGIRTEARTSTFNEWKLKQNLKAGTLGSSSALIPVVSYLTLPAELLGVMRIMHRTAIGVCEIELGHADDNTFAGVLAVWSGAVSPDGDLAKQITAKMLAKGAPVVGGTVGMQLAIKSFCVFADVIIAKKLGPKVAQKVAAKISAKLLAKASTRWIPILSALTGGGVNLWIVNGIANAAQEYADFIKDVSGLAAGPRS